MTMLCMNRIRALRKAQELTLDALGDRIGTSGSNLSKLERFDEKLDLKRMRTIARALGVRPVDLLTDEDNPERLMEQERELLALFRSLNPAGQERLVRVAEAVAEPIMKSGAA